MGNSSNMTQSISNDAKYQRWLLRGDLINFDNFQPNPFQNYDIIMAQNLMYMIAQYRPVKSIPDKLCTTGGRIVMAAALLDTNLNEHFSFMFANFLGFKISILGLQPPSGMSILS